MDRLDNVIQNYAWGSSTALGELMGRAVSGDRPEAELWMGAHPAAPSRIRRDGNAVSLAELIQASPTELLGHQVAQRFGSELPFLLKVLAANQPLSLQAHPSLEDARAGFERENSLGIPLNAPNRNYRDRNHKPELICALTRFDALCGFREPSATLRLFESLPVPGLGQLLQPLRDAPNAHGLAGTFEAVMSLESATSSAVVGDVARACEAAAMRGGEFAEEFSFAAQLAQLYPGDRGVLGALLLNLVQLAPGEALYLPAGNLHAYLRGMGVEVMASSDNVLRGGCTSKHVDVPELLRILDFRSGPVERVTVARPSGNEEVFVTPAPDFRLSRIRPSGGTLPLEARGPEILLCTEGTIQVGSAFGKMELSRGQSVFIAASEGTYELSGQGLIFRATVGDL